MNECLFSGIERRIKVYMQVQNYLKTNIYHDIISRPSNNDTLTRPTTVVDQETGTSRPSIGDVSGTSSSLVLVDQQDVYEKGNSWQIFNVTNAVSYWLNHPTVVLKLQVNTGIIYIIYEKI